MGEGYDVFLSHAWRDQRDARAAGRARRVGAPILEAALRNTGLEVFFDEHEIDEFAPLDATIRAALATSKVLVSWCSDLYLTRPACAAELTLAMTWSAGRSGASRVLVVNTETDVTHLPARLRANLVAPAPEPGDAAGFRMLADRIAGHCAMVDGPLGRGIDPGDVEWFPQRLASSTRFTGRFAELWDLHGILAGTELEGTTAARGAAVVDGIGGAGKTLLVLEYAHRFAAAWPGGVVWLNGHGFDRDQPPGPAESRQLAANALSSLASVSLDIDGVAMMDPAAVGAAIGRWFQGRGRVLWIVDDLGANADPDAWSAPMVNASTVFTTRVQSYEGIYTPLRLDQLSADDAFALLTKDYPPVDEDQTVAARATVERLGRHALAVDVTRARVRSGDDYRHQLQRLEIRGIGELDKAGHKIGLLAAGHTPLITATLAASIEELTPDGRELLDIASVFESIPLPDDTMIDVVAALDGDESEAETRVIDGMDDLANHSLARRVDAATTLHRLVIDLARIDQHVEAGDVIAAADTSLTVALAETSDERNLRRRRAHYDLGVTLPVTVESDLGIWLGRYERAIGDLASALNRGRHLAEVRNGILGSDHVQTLVSQSNLAGAYKEAGNLARAIRLFQQTLDTYIGVLGPDHHDTLICQNNLAGAYESAGDLARAIRLYQQTLDTYNRVLGLDHPDTLICQNNLAGAYESAGDLARAIRLYQQTLDSYIRVLGPDHPRTLTCQSNLAYTYRSAGDLRRAFPLFEETLDARRRILGPDHPDTLVSENILATAYGMSGDRGRALPLLEHTLDAQTRILGPDHPDTLLTQHNLARALSLESRHSEALALMESAAVNALRALGPDHSLTIRLNEAADAIRIGQSPMRPRLSEPRRWPWNRRGRRPGDAAS